MIQAIFQSGPCLIRADYREGHTGEILSIRDPRAWAGSLAFPVEFPDPEKVDAWVKECLTQGYLRDRVPVLWSFGKIYWENITSLIVIGG